MPADQNRNDRSRHANYIRMKKINTQWEQAANGLL
jgi:hypothetical protein